MTTTRLFSPIPTDVDRATAALVPAVSGPEPVGRRGELSTIALIVEGGQLEPQVPSDRSPIRCLPEGHHSKGSDPNGTMLEASSRLICESVDADLHRAVGS